MKPQKTKEIFKEYETETITDEVIEEIELNIKEYFGLIVGWWNMQSTAREEEEH